MKRLLAIGLIATLAGCVTSEVGSTRMVVEPPSPAIAQQLEGSDLVRNVFVNGPSTAFAYDGLSSRFELAEFNRAVAFSMANAEMLADYRGGNYDLDVEPLLLKRIVDQSDVTDMTVEAVVRYRLSVRQSGATLFDDAIRSTYSLPLADEAETDAVTARAIEGALAANLEALIIDLASLGV
jgi:hypothetical protein